DLGIDPTDRDRVLEVWNKGDLIQGRDGGAGEGALIISAQTGEGIDRLLSRIELRITGGLETFGVRLDASQAGLIDWIYRNYRVLQREDHEDRGVLLQVRASGETRRRIERNVAKKGP